MDAAFMCVCVCVCVWFMSMMPFLIQTVVITKLKNWMTEAVTM